MLNLLMMVFITFRNTGFQFRQLQKLLEEKTQAFNELYSK